MRRSGVRSAAVMLVCWPAWVGCLLFVQAGNWVFEPDGTGNRYEVGGLDLSSPEGYTLDLWMKLGRR